MAQNSTQPLFISSVMNVPDLFVNAIVINPSSIHLLNKSYNFNYYSEVLFKVRDKSQIVETANQLQNKITDLYPTCNCRVLQGSGTSSLLEKVVSKIVEQLYVFNAILDMIIVIRLLQCLFWIATEYEYELNELKILGASKLQIYVLFIILGVTIGNLGYLLGAMGSIVIPLSITYLLAIVTLQSATILPPSLNQILIGLIQINVLIFIIVLIPAYHLSSKRILKQKERE